MVGRRISSSLHNGCAFRVQTAASPDGGAPLAQCAPTVLKRETADVEYVAIWKAG